MNQQITRTTTFVHTIMKNKITTGSTVVDATMGNGHDTLFLASLVGKSGRVYSFDIQQTALDRTSELLREHLPNYNQYVRLIHQGHEYINQFVNESIDCAMFNLGYLPGGDRGIITSASTTIKAIEQIIPLLKKGGMISIILYYGHEGGELEKQGVLDYLKDLDDAQFTVLLSNYFNRKNHPPMMIMIEKNN